MEVESRFVFNSAAGVPVHEQNSLDSRYTQMRQQLEMALLSGERELISISTGQLRDLLELVKSTICNFAQASSDVVAIPPGF
jgi:hypothetical protein